MFDRLKAEADEKRLADSPENTQARTTGQMAGNAMISEDYLLNRLFTYHAPSQQQLQHYETLREAARHFAKVILSNVPGGADRSAALRKVREAVMTANAGIACDGISF
jgi:hypothetical protein